MRRSAIIIICLFTLFAPSFIIFGTQQQPEINKSEAIAEKREGLYIYVLCTPKNQYTKLQNIKIHFSMSGDNESLLSSLIKKAKKENPDCSGIIISSLSFEEAEVIKF